MNHRYESRLNKAGDDFNFPGSYDFVTEIRTRSH